MKSKVVYMVMVVEQSKAQPSRVELNARTSCLMHSIREIANEIELEKGAYERVCLCFYMKPVARSLVLHFAVATALCLDSSPLDRDWVISNNITINSTCICRNRYYTLLLYLIH